MKRNFTKIVSAGVLTLGMAIMPLTLPVQAQDNTTTTGDAQRTTTYDRNDFDWGWLGLLGLLGLAGLAGRKRNDETTRYRDPSAPGATSYRD
ncbi:WGxxGxxG-CTERM domain-containing protein [Nostoc sp. CHAB 5844]|nr:WGxxGxxG-CTERM domain-containing protein [Nostoc sp. CHAB 5844]